MKGEPDGAMELEPLPGLVTRDGKLDGVMELEPLPKKLECKN